MRSEIDDVRSGLEPRSLRTLCQEVWETFQEECRRRDVLFLLESDEAAPTVHADAAHLGRALNHLVADAVQLTPPGGRVTLWVGCEGGVPRIELQDGRPRASEWPPAPLPGAGKGLIPGEPSRRAEGRDSVEALRARLWAQNLPEGGACFCLELPAPG